MRPPRRLRPTRAGWIFFALTFGVGFAALNTGNNLLYLVLALMLAFLVLSGVLSESALRGIEVRRRLPRELVAGEEAFVTLEISNAQRRVAAYAVLVEDRIEGDGDGDRAAGRCFALRIEPEARETRSYRLRPERRGELAFRGFVVFTRFPFGLFSKSLLIEDESVALVYPHLEPVRVPREFGGAQHAGQEVQGPRGSGAEVTGLREFQRGDPPRRIDWKASLRSREVWVREVASDCEAEVEVRLRTRGQRPGEAFERAVSWSASEVAAFLDAGLRVGLRTDADFVAPEAGPQHRARLLAFLARLDVPGEEAA